MVKNMKRYQRQAKRDGKDGQEDLDIIPTTFVLPQDYALFVEVCRGCKISGQGRADIFHAGYAGESMLTVPGNECMPR